MTVMNIKQHLDDDEYIKLIGAISVAYKERKEEMMDK
jgi:hypothetical protein